MGETTLKEEIGKYGSVNGTQSKPSPSAEEQPHHHHHHYALFPGILYLAAFVVIYSGRLSHYHERFARKSRVTIACFSASF